MRLSGLISPKITTIIQAKKERIFFHIFFLSECVHYNEFKIKIIFVYDAEKKMNLAFFTLYKMIEKGEY